MTISVVLMSGRRNFCSTDSLRQWLKIGSCEKGSYEIKSTLICLCTFIASRDVSLCLAKLADSFVVNVWGYGILFRAKLTYNNKTVWKFFLNRGIKIVHQNIRKLLYASRVCHFSRKDRLHYTVRDTYLKCRNWL